MSESSLRTGRLSILVVALYAVGCSSPQKELERVAKDWCMTIRASQVLPVYPLTEDLQPGDVFIVQVPLSRQVEIYEDKGFLPLDQLVTRLSGLPYAQFYGDDYWKGTYAVAPHARPGWPPAGQSEKTLAPRAAFPTYNFSVDRGSGIKVAIPIQGIPVGLGIMGADRAAGSVTIKDAFTYGADGEATYRALTTWWASNPEIRHTFAEVVRRTNRDVYLRVVNRVYLTGGVEVSLRNLDALSAGADVGVPKPIVLPDLSEKSPEEVKTSVEAYKASLAALSEPLNQLQQNLPGGSVRFAQASRRAVTMLQTFDRPLAIGYLGFDVKVYKTGDLSPPIPSYAILTGLDPAAGDLQTPIEWGGDPELSDCYSKWLDAPGNYDRMVEWLKQQDVDADPADLYASDEYLDLLRKANEEFQFCASTNPEG